MKNTERKIAVIVASRPVSAGMQRYLPDDAFVIAADAGWKNCERLGIVPDLVVGDFDSSTPPQDAKELIRLPAEKDDTDTYFAARLALERGCTGVVLLGALGGRLDHTMANLQTMLMLAKAGVEVQAATEESCVYCIGPGAGLRLPAAGWRWLSVFAAGGVARGVYERGVKYPLEDTILTPDTSLGTSNEFAADVAEIGLREGYLYVMLSSEES